MREKRKKGTKCSQIRNLCSWVFLPCTGPTDTWRPRLILF
ncbi:unnamed protein product [Brassica napus]|uniref:(rape) hypothetical protein n=1 Tax=Brassica napus TaxID=3708 RepID=A0A816LM28_BRANA|nr:unnamed protein product [Brassica napus]